MLKKRLVRIKDHPLVKGDFLLIAWVCGVIVLVGLFSAVFVFVWTLLDTRMYKLDFCLSNSCIKYFAVNFEYFFTILKLAGGLLVGIFTLGTLGVAASSYVNNKKAFAMSNHIAHLEIFISYVEAEVTKRSLLSIESFDYIKWYNKIFADSFRGVFSISDDYFSFMNALNDKISYSNMLKERKEEGGYRYTHHQTRMIEVLSEVGIQVNRLSRIDFYNVESQLLDLIDTVNSSYCMIDLEEYGVKERLYE